MTMGPSYQYKGRVVRVIDGDTYEIAVDLGFRIYHSIHVRLRDFDTPELRSTNPMEVAHAKEARDFVAQMLPVNTECVLLTAKSAVYNRWEADVYFRSPGGEWLSVKEVLLGAGYEKRSTY